MRENRELMLRGLFFIFWSGKIFIHSMYLSLQPPPTGSSIKDSPLSCKEPTPSDTAETKLTEEERPQTSKKVCVTCTFNWCKIHFILCIRRLYGLFITDPISPHYSVDYSLWGPKCLTLLHDMTALILQITIQSYLLVWDMKYPYFI